MYFIGNPAGQTETVPHLVLIDVKTIRSFFSTDEGTLLSETFGFIRIVFILSLSVRKTYSYGLVSVHIEIVAHSSTQIK